MRHPSHLRTLLPLAALGLAGPAFAQISLSGNVSDDVTGPLLTGQVYLTTGSLTVPAGKTLTIQPGAILKMGSGHLLTAAGSLVSPAGTSAFVTSHLDDTLGGDTDGLGPTVGSAGDWAGLRTLAGGSIDIEDIWVGYAGSSVWSAIHGGGGTIRLNQCTITDSEGPGIDGTATDVDTIVLNTVIENCTGWAVDRVPIEQLPNFSNITATGNAGGDGIRLSSGNVDRDTTIGPDNLIDGLLLPNGSFTIQSGAKLTINAGVAVKLTAGALVTASGELDVVGTPADPVWFTSLADDSVFGDTQNDGAQPVGPADWSGVRSLAGGSVAVESAVLRYAGASVWSALTGGGGPLTVRNTTVELSKGDGLNVSNFDVGLIVEGCTFRDNTGWPIDAVPLQRVPGLLGNVASGNDLGDAVRSGTSSLGFDTTLIADNLIDSTLVLNGSLTVAPGIRLALREGIIVKQQATGLMTAGGTIELVGTQANPITFTSLGDDASGTDAANDGPTSGAPSDWSGLRALTGGRIEASWTDVRFAGTSIWSGFTNSGGELFIDHCSVVQSDGPGLAFNGSLAPCSVRACRFEDNTGAAIFDVPVRQLPNFDSNTASGNLGGDLLRGTNATLDQDTTVTRRNLIDGSLFLPGSFTVSSGTALTLEAGVGLKFGGSGLLTISGRLIARGTADDPVFLTSFEDDRIGGDDNLDGPTNGDPNDWGGLRNLPSLDGPGTVDLEHLVVRNGGSSIWSNLFVSGAGNRLFAVRSEDGGDQGFRLQNLTDSQVVNCVAWNNATAGFEFNGGLVDLVHATSAGNIRGVQTSAAHSGSVVNSVIFGNGTDLSLAGSTSVAATHAANAPVGSGNSTVDPLFVNAAAGDLRLAPGSSAVDSANGAVALPLTRDAADAPRLLSPSGLGGLQADRGAFEQARWSLAMTGSQAIGEPLSFLVSGQPGLAYLAYSPLQLPLLLEPYGVLLIGPAPLNELGLIPVGSPLALTLPDVPVLIGAEYGIQALAFFGADPLQSQLTDLARLRIQPALP